MSNDLCDYCNNAHSAYDETTQYSYGMMDGIKTFKDVRRKLCYECLKNKHRKKKKPMENELCKKCNSKLESMKVNGTHLMVCNQCFTVVREEPMKNQLTPNEFVILMRIFADNDDKELRHIHMDKLMCDFLSDLGYEEGIKVFKDTDKWWA